MLTSSTQMTKQVISRRRKNENVYEMSKMKTARAKRAKLFTIKYANLSSWLRKLPNWEFKKLRRELQRKRQVTIELCVRLSVLRLFHLGRVVQNRPSALFVAWHEWFSCKGKDWKIHCCEFALSSKPQIWKFHVVVWQTTSTNYAKKRAARAARLFFFIKPIKSLICGFVVSVAIREFKFYDATTATTPQILHI